jgi:hypothetical protein
MCKEVLHAVCRSRAAMQNIKMSPNPNANGSPHSLTGQHGDDCHLNELVYMHRYSSVV